jgi:hypothetical protein
MKAFEDSKSGMNDNNEHKNLNLVHSQRYLWIIIDSYFFQHAVQFGLINQYTTQSKSKLQAHDQSRT